MTISRRKLLAGSALLLLAGTGLAQEPAGADAAADAEPRAERERLRQHRENMSDEERQAMRERRRAEWESLSDEERTARRAQMGQRRGEMRERWNNLSDEERQAMREKREQMRGQRGNGERRRDRVGRRHEKTEQTL